MKKFRATHDVGAHDHHKQSHEKMMNNPYQLSDVFKTLQNAFKDRDSKMLPRYSKTAPNTWTSQMNNSIAQCKFTIFENPTQAITKGAYKVRETLQRYL